MRGKKGHRGRMKRRGEIIRRLRGNEGRERKEDAAEKE
jgi:hypothetical protein